MKLRPFQTRFVKGAFRKGIDTAALSIPRGNGKSCLAGHLLSRCLTPGDPMHEAGKEYLLLAASLEQARITYGFIREALEATKQYSWIDSTTRVGVTHKATNTRLRVLSSKAKSAFGIVGCPLLVGDEPGAWESIGGQAMSDAIFTAQGKPGSNLRVVLIGTLAPSASGFWHDLVDAGSNRTTYVQALKGDPKKWDKWSEIRRCNPLTAISPQFRAKLLEERDAARRDTRLKARFLSYRLNVPTGDESSMLLTVEDFESMAKREVPPRIGKPLVALDLGGNRAWGAAVSLWSNGRIEARALAPGLPDISAQEDRDLVPRGTYARLCATGTLHIAEGLRVPKVSTLIEIISHAWGRPASIICDRFRLDELRDSGVRCQVVPRVTRWSESSFDIRSLRSKVKDGPFAVAECSRSLLAASLAVAMVKNDDAGSVRLIKRGSNNTARDDVAAAMVLASGAFVRSAERTPASGVTWLSRALRPQLSQLFNSFPTAKIKTTTTTSGSSPPFYPPDLQIDT